MDEITTWLTRHQLGHLAPIFERHAVGLDILDRLTNADLKELGVALGDRYRLKSAIGERQRHPASESDAHLRHLTVLFSDLVDSTWLSEQLDVETYRGALRRYQSTVADVMRQHEGTVTRYDGDGIMVLFGFPKANEDDPDRAVRAALDSVAAVAALPDVESSKLASRIGVATGEVVVGDQIGEGLARQFAVSGASPNLAARLQGLAKPNSVVISETTLRLVTTELDTVQLPPTRVKGLSEPVRAFVVKGERESDRFARHSARGLTRLIARDAESAQLRRTWQAVCEGEGKATVVFGEAGIGKSRLISEFLADVPEDQVLRYFCLPRYQNSTLHPIVRQLQDAIVLERDRSPSTLRRRLARRLRLNPHSEADVLAVFETLLSLPGRDEAHSRGQMDREELFRAILHQLGALTRRGVTVVVVEDLHWADPTTLELLERVVATVPRLPVFLLATSRPDVVPTFTTSRAVSAIKLMPLTRRESLNLIEEVNQGRTLSRVDRTRIAERCDGVPLYLEEITRAALDQVDVSILERRNTDIPETLRDLFMARLDRLGTGSQLAQVASAFGRRFTAPQLQAVAGLDEEEVLSGLKSLENAGVLTRLEVAGDVSYQFHHALTADAAYASMLGETRRALHAKVARLLDADPDIAQREPETAAWHYEWADEVQPAIRLRELAGHRASLRSANVEAAYHFNEAVKLAGRLPPDETQRELELRLRLELGTQLIACYGNGAPQVEANFERARELCEFVPDEHQRWQALYGLWSFYNVNGRLREAKELGETLLELADRLPGSGASIQAHRAHGLCLFAMGIFEHSRQHLEHAVEIHDPQLHSMQRTGDISDVLVLAKCNLGWLCCFQGETQRALSLHDEAIHTAEALEHQHSLAFALALSAASHQALGDRNSTRSLSSRLVRQSESHSYPYWLAWGQMLLAWAQAGDVAGSGDATAVQDFDAGLEAYDKTGARMMNAYFLTLRAEVDVVRERYQEALARLREAEQLVETTALRFYAAEIPRLRAVAYSRMSQAGRADQALEQAIDIAKQQDNVLLLARIHSTRAQLLEAS